MQPEQVVKLLMKGSEKMPIDSFRNEYAFLSNFYECPIPYLGLTFRNAEAAFQAAKTINAEERKEFVSLSASQAKRKGRRVKLRSDWEQMKVTVMREVLGIKFLDPELSSKLLATGNEELIEGNTWNDRFWGVCRGSGRNVLGKLLMEIREERRQK